MPDPFQWEFETMIAERSASAASADVPGAAGSAALDGPPMMNEALTPSEARMVVNSVEQDRIAMEAEAGVALDIPDLTRSL